MRDWTTFDRSQREACRQCPRYADGIFVPPKVEPGCELMFIAESPGQDEIAPIEPDEREPLIGASGKILNMTLRKAGVHRELVSLGNAALCGLKGRNEKPDTDTLECCAPLVNESIDDADPAVIIALGAVSMLRFTGKDKITQWMGSIMELPERAFIGKSKRWLGNYLKSGAKKGEKKLENTEIHVSRPSTADPYLILTLHPVDVIYEEHRPWPLFLSHIQRAVRVARDLPMIEVGEEVEPGMDKVSEGLRYLEKDTLALDLEASRESGNITIVGLASSAHESVALHPSQTLYDKLSEWLANPENLVIVHNSSYDLRKLMELGIQTECQLFDTFHAAQYERPDLRKQGSQEGVAWNPYAALDAVASRIPNLWYANWKEMFRQGAQLDEAVYNKLDTRMTFAVAEWLFDRLETTARLDHFLDTLMPLQKMLVEMTHRGVQVDEERLDAMIRKQSKLVKKLYRMWEEHGPDLNLTQTVKLMEFYYDELGLEEQTTLVKGKRRRTLNREAIAKLAALYPERRELKALSDARHLEKMLNGYMKRIKEGLDVDGRFHFEFNLSGTYTGRLSSDAQQFPRPTKDGKTCEQSIEGCHCGLLRRLIVPDPGDASLAVADYSQIEAIITSILAEEEWLVEKFRDPSFDFHQETTDYLNRHVRAGGGGSYDRGVGKMVNHALGYGMTWKGLKKHLGCTKTEAIEIERAVHKLRHATVAWWKEIESQLRRQGWVENPWHRRFYFTPRVNRQGYLEYDLPKAVASVPQSSAFEVIARAMLRCKQEGLKVLIQAHDELIVSVEYEDDPEILVECLQQPVRELRGWRFRADLGIGSNWYEGKLNG